MKKIESLYIHFPFCKHLCNYCDFYKKVSNAREQDLEAFHSYLQSSYEAHEKLMKENGYSWGPLKTLYLGGGTPSLWGMEGKNFIEKFFEKNNIQLDQDCEFTMEVNPGRWEEDILNSWEKIGVNRYSLGIQSLNPSLSKYLDRVHSISDVYDTLNFFSKKKANYSVDFMLGLPFSEQENRDVVQELNEVLKYSPQHFSVYILTVKDNYPHFAKLPGDEVIESEYLKVSNFLQNHGFSHYEVSNFALPEKESRHNLRYWHSMTVGALGPSATGFMREAKLRYKWKPNSPVPELEKLTNEEFALEEIYMCIRSSAGLPIKYFKEEAHKFEAIYESWVMRDLAKVDQRQHVILTAKGYLILDSLIGELFTAKLIK